MAILAGLMVSTHGNYGRDLGRTGWYLFRGPSDQTVGLSVYFKTENGPRWGHTCCGGFEWFIEPMLHSVNDGH